MYGTSKTILERKKRALGIWDETENMGKSSFGNATAKVEIDSARSLVGEGKDVMSILRESPPPFSATVTNAFNSSARKHEGRRDGQTQ